MCKHNKTETRQFTIYFFLRLFDVLSQGASLKPWLVQEKIIDSVAFSETAYGHMIFFGEQSKARAGRKREG